MVPKYSPGEYGLFMGLVLLCEYTGIRYSNIIKEVNDMYFIGLIVFIAILAGTTIVSGTPAAFVDLPSIIAILAFCVPMLMASGLLPDFLRGFRIMGQKVNTWSLLELKKTDIALKLTTRLLLLSGILGSIIGIIGIASSLGSMSKLGPNLAVALLTLFYSILFSLILMPVQARVKAIMITLDEEASYEKSMG